MKTLRPNTSLIRIDKFYFEKTQIPKNILIDKFLLLRKIKNEGEKEVVNNYQLGKLKKWQEAGVIEFTIIKKS